MLAHRLRRLFNIKITLAQRLVFAGYKSCLTFRSPIYTIYFYPLEAVSFYGDPQLQVIKWTLICDTKVALNIVNPFSAGTVFIRQNLTYKKGPSTERIKLFIMAVDP